MKELTNKRNYKNRKNIQQKHKMVFFKIAVFKISVTP